MIKFNECLQNQNDAFSIFFMKYVEADFKPKFTNSLI